jgi:hypothetical protein
MFRVMICGVFGFMKRSQRGQSDRTTRIVRTNTQHGSPIHSTRKVYVPDTVFCFSTMQIQLSMLV